MRFARPESGTTISFQLDDVVCPDNQALWDKITGQLNISGKVLYLSDSGDEHDVYAIVEVPGIMSPVIVPIDRVCLSEMQQAQATV